MESSKNMRQNKYSTLMINSTSTESEKHLDKLNQHRNTRKLKNTLINSISTETLFLFEVMTNLKHFKHNLHNFHYNILIN
jgi:hypothetical protein